MKLFLFSIVPFLLSAVFLADDRCNRPAPAQTDGPYVFYQGKKAYVKYVLQEEQTLKTVRTDTLADLGVMGAQVVRVSTGAPGEDFVVQLKSGHENEKAEYPVPQRMLAVSDIEGNFTAFRKLLQANGVIDSTYKWTFGNGHLVLTGDFFDRGEYVTQVLWLIYSLEDQAKAAGGYVHYILGNHEIMNLGNDFRYVHPKYIENAGLMGMQYRDLFTAETELGRWLRSKNIAEKIGDFLFVHGGISAELNAIDIGVTKMNKLARPMYPDTTYKYKDIKTELLFSDYGPFWYRGYYMGQPRASSAQIDSTLNLYKVKYIATGHTVVADTISRIYSGKVFNTDVHHAKGISEGLLMENNRFYRVNQAGEKFDIGN